jgi:hypothetical protein
MADLHNIVEGVQDALTHIPHFTELTRRLSFREEGGYKKRKMQKRLCLVFNRPRLKSGLIAKVHLSGLRDFSFGV